MHDSNMYMPGLLQCRIIPVYGRKPGSPQNIGVAPDVGLPELYKTLEQASLKASTHPIQLTLVAVDAVYNC